MTTIHQNQKDSSQTVLVDRNNFYIPIDKNTPRGVKCILIRKESGVGVIGELNKTNDSFFDHYSPMPIFK